MVKQYIQRTIQSVLRIKQAITKRVFIAFIFFTVLFGILTGIGMSAYDLLPKYLTKIITAYWVVLGPFIGALVGVLGASLIIQWKRFFAYLRQSLPTRHIQITVISLSFLTVIVCSSVIGIVTVLSRRSDFVSIPLTSYIGKLVFIDPMHDNHLGYNWTAAPTANAACVFTAAGYQVTVSQPHTYQYCVAKQTDFSTFAYQADMIFVNGSGGGIVFYDGETAYNVLVDNTGQFILFTYGPGQDQDTLARSYPFSYISYHQRMTITLVVKPTMIEVYLDSICVTCNKPVLRRTPSHGAIGVLAAIEDGQPDTQTEVLFENVQVWKL